MNRPDFSWLLRQAIASTLCFGLLAQFASAQVGIGNTDPLAPEEEPLLQPERRTTDPSTPTNPTPQQTTLQPEPVRGVPVPLPSTDTGRALPGGLLSEGSFVAGALGKPALGKSGAWYFIFEPDQRGPGGVALPAMVIMPGPNLASLERSANQLGEQGRLRVTGQVFVYAGLNHLALMAPPLIEADQPTRGSAGPKEPAAAAAEPSADAKPGPGGATPDPNAPASEPTIQEIIERMDRAVGSSRRVELPTSGNGEPKSGEPARPTGIVPGGFLASRKGRLVRSSDGTPLFVVDNGQSGKSESPMTVLPCQNLARMESVAAAQGERITFSLSGDVFVYRGQNYVIPRMFIVNRPTDLIASGQ